MLSHISPGRLPSHVRRSSRVELAETQHSPGGQAKKTQAEQQGEGGAQTALPRAKRIAPLGTPARPCVLQQHALLGQRTPPVGQLYPTQGRRTVLLSTLPLPLVAASLADALRGELSLWQQEADLYRRRAGEALRDVLPLPPSAAVPRALRAPLDPGLARLLLTAPLSVMEESGLPAWSRERYDTDHTALYRQELPYFRSAALCGGCGATAADGGGVGGGVESEEGDLSDADWFDFLSYVQYKAIARQLPPDRGQAHAANAMELMHGPTPGAETSGMPGSPSMSEGQRAVEALWSGLGARVLAYARADVAAAAAADSGADAAAAAAVLSSESAALDNIRGGVRQLLRWFQAKGMVLRAGIAQMGISRDEFENHEVWSAGEPAFLKYWLSNAAGMRSGLALRQEEGFSQEFVGSTVRAYLSSCGVRAVSWRLIPSLTSSDLLAEQCTLRRERALTPAELDADWTPFVLDLCPGGEVTGCY